MRRYYVDVSFRVATRRDYEVVEEVRFVIHADSAADALLTVMVALREYGRVYTTVEIQEAG